MTSSVSKSICSLKKMLLVLALVILSPLASLKAADINNYSEQTDRQRIGLRVAQEWLLVGTTQYNRGFYLAAERSLLMAKNYQDYLTVEDRDKLYKLLEKTHTTAVEQKRISSEVEAASNLIKDDKFIEAKTKLEKIKIEPNIDKNQLKKAELLLETVDNSLQTMGTQRIMEGIAKADSLIKNDRSAEAAIILEDIRKDEQLDAEVSAKIDKRLLLINDLTKKKLQEAGAKVVFSQQKQIDKLYAQGLEYSRNNQPDKAREVFSRIDKILAERAGLSAEVNEQDAIYSEDQQQPIYQPKPEEEITNEQTPVEEFEPVDVNTAGIENRGDDDIEIVDRKIRILQSYVKAIVKDAIAKSQNYAARDEFKKAKKTIASAEQVISEHRQHIGEKMFVYYNGLLIQQSKQIAQQEIESAW